MNQKIEEIIQLYNTRGCENYFGENVSKREIMIQSAVSADEHMESEELILGCLLHNIGHLLENDDIKFSNYGKLGSEYLEKMGMNKKVCKLVEKHIYAQRYLVSIDKTYYDKLSEATKKIIDNHGGEMNEVEINKFENDVDMIEILGVQYHNNNRHKIKIKDLPTIESFIPLIKKYIKRTITEYI